MLRLRFPFNDSDLVCQPNNGIHNMFYPMTAWGQAGQDFFVLGLLNGKKNGTYLEIGSWHALDCSNTALLEAGFGWRGASIDIEKQCVDEHRASRRHYVEQADATKVDYSELLLRAGIYEKDIDYASVDCEPPSNTFEALLRLPLDTHRFSVITFEHDSYAWGNEYKYRSRTYLKSKGYELLVTNISPDGISGDFEDWWIHPELIDANTAKRFRANDNSIKHWATYIFSLV